MSWVAAASPRWPGPGRCGADATPHSSAANYMAPEQARPGAAGPQADLYSLGCVAYECLLGEPPYTGRDFPALLYAHTHDPIPRTGDPRLDTFFSRALAKAPEDRFAS